GYEYGASVAVAATLVVGFALALALVILAFRFLVRLPNRMNFASRARRGVRGFSAVARVVVWGGAGARVAARRLAREAERLLGREPLTLLLKAQAAQVSGDRNAAEGSFRRMLDNDETRVLGLRGLF